MELLEDREQLAAWRAECQRAGVTVGFVPTMGALHAGHLALVERAMARCGRVVVSLFVNPTQFGPNEDFSRYPRTIARDRALLEEAGAHALFLPTVETIYPPGFQTTVKAGRLADQLCGASRPGHFDGVATVVTILLNLVRPEVAFFGLKDYQQFAVIRRLVADLALPVALEGVATVRDPDGLALSSRNRYLSPEQRQRAVALHRALSAAHDARRTGESDPQRLESLARETLAAAVDRIDYVAIRDAETLGPWQDPARDPVLLVAAFVGDTRLIDNRVLTRAGH